MTTATAVMPRSHPRRPAACCPAICPHRIRPGPPARSSVAPVSLDPVVAVDADDAILVDHRQPLRAAVAGRGLVVIEDDPVGELPRLGADVVGLAAGLLGGPVDFIIMRLVEVFTAIPALMLALILLAVFGGGVYNVILALGIVAWLDACRLLRAQLLSLRERDFVLAARTIGVSNARIATRHLLPNAIAPLIVAVSIGIPVAIFAEAGLSFLGLGINDPIPSWGKMVGNSMAYVRVYWFLGLFPTLAIAITMLGFTFLGDGLRDAFDTSMDR